jgi:carbonic anhydrase/acetyltransferase-like protein (isoleucine patch superfamily)
MQKLVSLMDRIIRRVNLNLRGFDFDIGPWMRGCIPVEQLLKFYAFYAVTTHHPIHFHFSNSNLSGSYFLGKCRVDNSVLYKSDIRGDELKLKGDTFSHRSAQLTLDQDEQIWISDSFLIKALIHNHSHDPETPEIFHIKNSAACHYANIHGAPIEGSFLGPFSTVDLTAIHGCVLGAFAYVQVGELWHQKVEPGQIWINQYNAFDFKYRFPAEKLERYVKMAPGGAPVGLFLDFINARKHDFRKVFDSVNLESATPVPKSSAASRYAVIKPDSRLGENVLIAQRAYIDNSVLGNGANAQENCFIINSWLQGNNVTAHGAKLIDAQLEDRVFVGFNSFVRGLPDAPLAIGRGTILMPHTIIDLKQPLSIPAEHLVWGHIAGSDDLQRNSIPLAALERVGGGLTVGGMEFNGSGSRFVGSFRKRIDHILEANGAYFDGSRSPGHAQRGQNVSYNIIQAYPVGPRQGMYPTIDIQP